MPLRTSTSRSAVNHSVSFYCFYWRLVCERGRERVNGRMRVLVAVRILMQGNILYVYIYVCMFECIHLHTHTHTSYSSPACMRVLGRAPESIIPANVSEEVSIQKSPHPPSPPPPPSPTKDPPGQGPDSSNDLARRCLTRGQGLEREAQRSATSTLPLP